MSCHGFLRPSAAVELSNPSTGPVSICGLVPRNDSWKEPIGPPLEMQVVLLSGSLLGSRSLFCTRREEERSERNEHVESVNEVNAFRPPSPHRKNEWSSLIGRPMSTKSTANKTGTQRCPVSPNAPILLKSCKTRYR
jgi:hypothetical protein